MWWTNQHRCSLGHGDSMATDSYIALKFYPTQQHKAKLVATLKECKEKLLEIISHDLWKKLYLTVEYMQRFYG